jgi:hypothetical protein
MTCDAAGLRRASSLCARTKDACQSENRGSINSRAVHRFWDPNLANEPVEPLISRGVPRADLVCDSYEPYR